jgi:hypothetical protein
MSYARQSLISLKDTPCGSAPCGLTGPLRSRDNFYTLDRRRLIRERIGV